LSDNPAWLDKLLDQEAVFRPDTIVEPVERVYDEPKVSTKPRVDLRQYFNSKGIKLTCSFCELEFVSSQIKGWWRKPKNKYGKRGIPYCPRCNNAGAITGWGVDWRERRKLGDLVRREKQQAAITIQKAKEMKGGDKDGSERNHKGNKSLFPYRC